MRRIADVDYNNRIRIENHFENEKKKTTKQIRKMKKNLKTNNEGIAEWCTKALDEGELMGCQQKVDILYAIIHTFDGKLFLFVVKQIFCNIKF